MDCVFFSTVEFGSQARGIKNNSKGFPGKHIMILNLTAFFVRTEKRLNTFLVSGDSFSLSCGFQGGNENSSKIFASSPFFDRPSLSRAARACTFHNIPQMESLFAG